MAERRSAARKKAFLQGRIFFNQRRTSIDCLIRDFCEHGARLTFSSMTATPDMVELYIPNKDESYRAKVQWRNANEIGVGFEREAASPPLVPEAAPPADVSARIHKLEHALSLLQRKFNELQTVVRQIQGAD
jgi:PilZ domain-containing protein